MDIKNLVLFLFLFCLVNGYVLGEEEEQASFDKFDQVILTSTVPPKTLPTSTTKSISSKTVPTNLSTTPNATEDLPANTDAMKETTFYMVGSVYYTTYLQTSTKVPSDVDGVYASCMRKTSVRGTTSTTTTTKAIPKDAYVCNKDEKCFKHYTAFYYSTFPYEFDCDLYTSKSTQPTPTKVVSSDLCLPTLSTSTYYRRTPVTSTVTDNGWDEEGKKLVTYYTVYSITKTETNDVLTRCSSSPTPPVYTSIRNPHTPYKTFTVGEDLEDPKRYITYDIMMNPYVNYRTFRTVPFTVPSEVKDYAVTCSTSISNPPKRRDYIPETVTPSYGKNSSKSIPNISYSTSSSSTTKISKVIPTTSRVSNTVTKTTAFNGYCENSTSCFRKYTNFVDVTNSGYYRTYYFCTVFTHNGSEPTPTSDIKFTSHCKPTRSSYITGTWDIIDDYGTIMTNGDMVTDILYNVRTTYSTRTTTTYCIEPTSTISTVTKSTTTTPTTTTTTTTIPITTPTTIKSTKCIPNVITVTEKEKITVTEKETITVTVTEDDSTVTPIGKDDSSCASKWGQCGGIDFKGPTCCKSGLTCKEVNKYYSQCL